MRERAGCSAVRAHDWLVCLFARTPDDFPALAVLRNLSGHTLSVSKDRASHTTQETHGIRCVAIVVCRESQRYRATGSHSCEPAMPNRYIVERDRPDGTTARRLISVMGAGAEASKFDTVVDREDCPGHRGAPLIQTKEIRHHGEQHRSRAGRLTKADGSRQECGSSTHVGDNAETRRSEQTDTPAPNHGTTKDTKFTKFQRTHHTKSIAEPAETAEFTHDGPPQDQPQRAQGTQRSGRWAGLLAGRLA